METGRVRGSFLRVHGDSMGELVISWGYLETRRVRGLSLRVHGDIRVRGLSL